ncbi:LysR family transcriptional regulator [Flaviflagellibacter deserti]|uniref:LysR family transcriptional regulator n=1 Tax=Flaviflagellibacter deserti TaxID=2267266 RepID=A0ABV9YZB2_9HYPH
MIDKLEFLLALASERHFRKAAEACGVTQPTLSSGIQNLEEMLGVRLVDRGSRFQGFTPEGERVLEWARRIVADSRAMRQDVSALKKGLSGQLRIAAIPTALPMVAALTTPFRQRHPDVSFNIISRTSVSILTLLENLEVDIGITYVENEPVGRMRTLPLYREEYQLLTSVDGPYGSARMVTWEQAGKLPLCLMSPDMQNRRIIDKTLESVGAKPEASLESDSVTALVAHVRTGNWSTVMPKKFADMFDLPESVRSIPLVEPELVHMIGLVVVDRNPLKPLTAALWSEAQRLAPVLALTSSVSSLERHQPTAL